MGWKKVTLDDKKNKSNLPSHFAVSHPSAKTIQKTPNTGRLPGNSQHCLARPAAAAPRRVDPRGPAPTSGSSRLLPPLRRSLPSADPAPPLRRAQASEPLCVAYGCCVCKAEKLPQHSFDCLTAVRSGTEPSVQRRWCLLMAWSAPRRQTQIIIFFLIVMLFL